MWDAALLAVDPVPWARAQMAFTLAAHIILVPLGVAWMFIILIAHRRYLKHGDEDAKRLAQRWSKVLAVTFAVGAVTGTVLSFEFGLLWPRFMAQWGDVFGVAFAVEGLAFFLEAIFIGIYLYGWKRLPPNLHFWSGVPIVLTGILGTFSVLAANSWMNEPQGFTLNDAGEVVDVRPLEVLFNRATPYEFTHMLVAAYMVAGFLVASVYAVAMLRGRRDRYHRLGFLIPFTVAAIATPIQMFVGDWAARSVFNDQPAKFAALELVPRTSTDVPETIGGYMTSDCEVRAGIAIPGLASLLSGYSTDTEIQGLCDIPENERPTIRQANIVHLAWDTMVGIGTALFLLSVWFLFTWWRRRDLPKTKWFLRAAALAGVGSIVAMEAGWIVTEVGRQPWIVYGYMRVEDAATGNEAVWLSTVVIAVLYTAIATTLILVLRAMARRWRQADDAARDGEAGSLREAQPVPYGPRSDRATDEPSVGDRVP